ncbi:hypothetical protein MPUL_33980 [Mycolicibacterium pulveris]|uniref:Uncharacterized protein n=1 Tax=Mycolicibacterium pulveris TaxID=36813 RepID=A0A7I7UML9_MYCPV|nr:hypothetical protein MPUL_33980 [Mycolicibacterium pulveris]
MTRAALLPGTPTMALGVIGATTAAEGRAVAAPSDFTGDADGGGLPEPVLGTARIPAAITTVAMDLCGEKAIADLPAPARTRLTGKVSHRGISAGRDLQKSRSKRRSEARRRQ